MRAVGSPSIPSTSESKSNRGAERTHLFDLLSQRSTVTLGGYSDKAKLDDGEELTVPYLPVTPTFLVRFVWMTYEVRFGKESESAHHVELGVWDEWTGEEKREVCGSKRRNCTGPGGAMSGDTHVTRKECTGPAGLSNG